MKNYTFSDLVDISKLKESMDSFYRAFGLTNAILGPNEEVLVSAGWIDICTKYHRVNPATSARCRESDAFIKTHIHEGDYASYQCKNGLWDVAFPIVIDGQHLATFFFGQFFYSDNLPDREFFVKQAEENCFEIDDYMAAYSKIPRFTRTEIGNIIAYYKSIADIMVNTGFNNLKLLREIEERKLAEKALREASDIINMSPAVVFRWKNEENWPVEFVTENVWKLFGYTAEEFLSGNVLYSRIIHSDDLEKVTEEVTRYSDNRDTLHFIHEPYRIITKDGEVKWIDDRTDIYRDENGAVQRYQGIVLDITRRVGLEEQLRQSQKMESVGRLAGGIAHDFNNILTAIIGNVDLLMLDISREDRSYTEIEEIKNCAIRAADLTRQLLAFSRRQIIKPQVLDLNRIIDDFYKMLKRLIGEDIEYITVPGKDLWKVEIDSGQFEQVISNLVVNARDAMPNGGELTIETANVAKNDPLLKKHSHILADDCVMISVRDTGMGMSDNIQTKIFEPFFTTKELGKGTGLGLSTCFGIVKQNNGHIWVDSRPGEGTTVKICLPRSQKHKMQVAAINSSKFRATGKETILVVEDEPAVRDMLVKVLRNTGYTVIEAVNGNDALEKSGLHGDNKIDLLITDVIMPQKGGRELANIITTLRPDIKVLFVSGYTENTIVHHGVLDRDIHFLQKPFTRDDILDKIRTVLS